MDPRKVVRAAMQNCIVDICGELSKIISVEINKNKRCWVRKWLRRRETYGASSTLLRELAEEDLEEYRNRIRMTKEQFETLLAQIAPQIKRNDTVMRLALSVRIKLEITLNLTKLSVYTWRCPFGLSGGRKRWWGRLLVQVNRNRFYPLD
jgi:hypothetical protein